MVNPLDVEYVQWQLTNMLMGIIITRWCDARTSVYEFHYIIERMLMGMCNSELRHSRLVAPWTVYYRLTVDDPFIKQMAVEAIQKCNMGTRVDELVEYVVSTINQTISKGVSPPKNTAAARIRIYRTRLTYRNFMIDLPKLTIAKLKRGNKRDMMIVVMRYCTIILKSQQWSIPKKLFDLLYTTYNVRFEGFASPLSSNFVNRKRAMYCSMFDCDKAYGSIGNFMDIDMLAPIAGVTIPKIGWVLHPPYVDSVLMETSAKILRALDDAKLMNVNLFIVLVMPYWPESRHYDRLKQTHHPYAELIMTRNTHYYENHGKVVGSSFDTVVFIFDRNQSSGMAYADIISAMYINNAPNKTNYPRATKALLSISDTTSYIIQDQNDPAHKVTLSINNNASNWNIKYHYIQNQYIVNVDKPRCMRPNWRSDITESIIIPT